jgi:hypothetical protein
MALDQGIIRIHPEGPPGRGLEPMAEITPDLLEAGSGSCRRGWPLNQPQQLIPLDQPRLDYHHPPPCRSRR